MLAVALGGLAVNLVGIAVLKPAATESLNLRGAYFEVLSDLLSSVGVVAGAAIMLATGWSIVDPILSAAIGLFILPRTWALLREAVGVLLEGTLSDVNLTALRDALLAVTGVAGIHDLHVWTLTSGVNAMSVHVMLRDGADHDGVRSAVRSAVSGPFRIAHVTVQAERGHCGDREAHA
jgi:cobalt-zinc-cadmium efflux system protein